jgi:D-sedoheptulose 7-phosphate isomerase
MNSFEQHLQVTTDTYRECEQDIKDVSDVIVKALKAGKKIILCGNGGSAADAQHFAAELTGRFENTHRTPLPAIALNDVSSITAIANDYGYDGVFARTLSALGNEGDVIIAISTSGKSKSVLNSLIVGRDKKMHTILLTGRTGMSKYADHSINVQSARTSRIQEMHSLILHMICEAIDDAF